ncbi:MAG TPA: Solitary outer membrane autotransporter beta-barrel domain [Tepidisphaeraceae bacterium]|jgi:hypothetical protein
MRRIPSSLLGIAFALAGFSAPHACPAAFEFPFPGAGAAPSAGQAMVPPGAVSQFQGVIGNRVQALTILAGDYSTATGIYTFNGQNLADLSLIKVGGSGNLAGPAPLFGSRVKWAPVLAGNVGYIAATNEFTSGPLNGNKSEYDVFALEAGGGARFYFTDHLSLAPIVCGLYSHTENKFTPQNAMGEMIAQAARGTYVDWRVDTWSVTPSVDLHYDWQWGRTTFTFSSHYSYFHTQSFNSSSAVISVHGDSSTWENKLDADVPLGVPVFGGELHTGGFFSRTELGGGAADGLQTNHFYTVNGRLVVSPLGNLWNLHWIGVGASYLFGGHLNGYTIGVDFQFEF